MANRHNHHEPVLTKPLPGRTVPVVIILCLLASLVLGYRYFFGAPGQLLGGPPPPNEYVLLVPKPQPVPVTPPPADVAAPAGTPTLTDTTSATATTSVTTPPADTPKPTKKKSTAPTPPED